MRILITGVAGFIGFFLSRRFLEEGRQVWGIDNLSPYYDPELKKDRLSALKKHKRFYFEKLDLADAPALNRLFAEGNFTHVINLAAQAGVRYSVINPAAYVQSNLLGFANLLECCRHYPVEHLVYASSSSVYGLNAKIPFSPRDAVGHPVSLYAATKKAGELLAHSYSHLYGIPCTGLRFFTVYGPWGRPDMAYFSFTRRILAGEPIQLFNQGKMRRDFTYIGDIIRGVAACVENPAEADAEWNPLSPAQDSSSAPYRIYNLGNNNSVELERFVAVLEDALRLKAVIEYLPMQPGDVQTTFADIESSSRNLNFTPEVSLEEGLPEFVRWYKNYYRCS
ncbi:MAG: NAD-dependent epimerase [Deltaproteobacteria bacterium]|jgi:UDP-glucuronate 4-epimerase|nr:NAD-dependent epimerase [Deltaproteobacteria bacterium]